MDPTVRPLQGQVALITGGGGGIGRAIALAFAEAGADIVIADIVAERCAEVATRVEALGRRALACPTDVTETDQIAAAIAAADAAFGRLDILVNNAGGVSGRAFAQQSERSWRKHIDLNLVSMFAATSAAIPLMIRGGRGGAIVNVSSIEASRAAPLYAVYAACKAGMNNFTRTMALELGEHGIRVNAIAPDYTVTPGTRGNSNGPVDERKWFQPSPAQNDAAARRIPLGRAGIDVECGQAALFLASPASSYITGTILPVDGGAWASSGWVRDRSGKWVLAEPYADFEEDQMMQFNIPLPFDRHDAETQFGDMDAVAEVGAAIERAGFSGALVTDHPCPTGRWLDAGGHHAHDPFVMLSLVAAVTKKVRLQTGILVLPYRNPFIVARSIASLDRFSGGRVTIGLGAGYMKGEYRALGVDFDARNELMDEYLKALKLALSGEEFAFAGTGFEAFGNRIQPGPVQKPHPPLLVGGNARRAIRRAVELGDGWYPFFTVGGVTTATTRTADITNEEDLAEALHYMHAHCETVGRETPPIVAIGSIVKPGESWTPQLIIDRAGRFAEMGVVAAGMNIDGRTRAEWCDNAERFGQDVIAKLGAA